MKTTVNLQGQFSYAFWPILLIGLLLLVCVIILILPAILKLFKPKEKAVEEVIEIKKPVDVMGVKDKYLGQLNQIEQDINSNRIPIRDAYQNMSACIRGFVKEMTGIEVTNYTLQDIQRLNMPLLATLIEEYYAPEFAANSIGDSMASLQKTKRAIERWN